MARLPAVTHVLPYPEAGTLAFFSYTMWKEIPASMRHREVQCGVICLLTLPASRWHPEAPESFTAQICSRSVLWVSMLQNLFGFSRVRVFEGIFMSCLGPASKLLAAQKTKPRKRRWAANLVTWAHL